MCRYAAWRGSMWITALAHLSESALTFASVLLALLCSCVRCRPVRQVRVSRTASETHVKGALNELCAVRSILKAMLFEDRQKKGQLPSLFERHPARSGVGTPNAT